MSKILPPLSVRDNVKDAAEAVLKAYNEGRLSAQGDQPACKYRDASGRPCAIGAALNEEQIEKLISLGDLDSFTQGYIEALFFTETSTGLTTDEWIAGCEGALPSDAGFADLSPAALAQIIEDCQGFQDQDHEHPWLDWCEDQGRMAEAGRDFWYTRNHHGCGFWDGDWPEPYATHLTEAAHKAGEVDVCFGDDRKVHL